MFMVADRIDPMCQYQEPTLFLIPDGRRLIASTGASAAIYAVRKNSVISFQ